MVYEIIHYIKNKHRGPPIAALKVDLNKAYDQLKWDFIEAVLRHVDFPKLWISITMEFITTMSHSILLNCKAS